MRKPPFGQFRAEGLLHLAPRILNKVRILGIIDLVERLEGQRLGPRGVGLLGRHQPCATISRNTSPCRRLTAPGVPSAFHSLV